MIKSIIATTRPPFLLLTPCCLSIAISFAVANNVDINLLSLFLIIFGSLTAHASVNMLNEYHDFKTGLDFKTKRTPFSGGSGSLPNHPEIAESVNNIGLGLLGLTVVIGFYLLSQTGWLLIPIVLLGCLLVYFYTGKITHSPFLCFIAPGTAFGLLIINGAYYVLAKELDFTVFTVSLIPFLLVNNLLLLNQIPDIEADQSVGRSHLPILIGKQKTIWVYCLGLIAAYLLLLLCVAVEFLPTQSLLSLLTLLLTIPAINLSLRYFENIEKLQTALALNVGLTLSFPVLISVGIIWQSL